MMKNENTTLMSDGGFSLFSSWWSRVIITIIGLMSLGLLIEIVYLIQYEHGFVLNAVLVKKLHDQIKSTNLSNKKVEMIEFKRKTVYLREEENSKNELLNLRRESSLDEIYIVKLVPSQDRTSTLTKNSNFDRTFLLKSGYIYLIRVDKDELHDIENDIVWIKPFENDLKTNIDFLHIYNATKNSRKDTKISLELLLIPSLRDIGSIETVSESFKSNFISFMKIISDNFWIDLIGDGMVDLEVPMKTLDEVSRYLLENTCVKWIQRRQPIATSNKMATKLVQGLRTDSELSSVSNPIWDRNITGEGEIITVADTGLDWDNCYFSDPLVSVTAGTVNNSHRKVLAYINMSKDGKTADGKDRLDGHGTHVCGSLAGDFNQEDVVSNNSMSAYNGIAYKSKLVIMDLDDENENELLIPSDIRTMFLQGYNLNSKIFSNSYTCSYASVLSCSFDCQCYLLDDDEVLGPKFSLVANEKCRDTFGMDCCRLCNNYGKRDMLIDDFLYENQDAVVLFAAGNEGNIATDGTIATTSKNAIVIGASMTSNQGFVESIKYMNLVEEAEICGVSVENCCSDYSCSFTCCPTRMENQMVSLKKQYNQNNLAHYSARGPATGNRIKPDCVTTGEQIISARSDGDLTTNQCANIQPNSTNDAALIMNSGTSMSTPIASGAVALIRESFRKKKGLSNPSGPLLKAALIHSCTPQTGTVSLDGSDGQLVSLSNKATPNKYEGFGSIGLNNVLEFEDSPFTLELHDRKQLSVMGSSEILCFTTTSKDSNSFIQATLSWYDIPSQVNTVPTLQADLDLEIDIFDNGKLIQKVYGNFNTEKDEQNNVEKVSLKGLNSQTDGEFYAMVKVRAAGLYQTQKYALVLTRSKNLKSVDNSYCQALAKVNGEVSLSEIAVILVISLVAFLLVSVFFFSICVCVCVLRKSSESIKVSPGLI